MGNLAGTSVTKSEKLLPEKNVMEKTKLQQNLAGMVKGISNLNKDFSNFSD